MDGWLTERKRIADSIKHGRPAPTGDLRGLPWPEIAICDDVFQHRSGNQAASEAHTRELVKTLDRNHGRPLDAVVVFWIGDRWCCIDGHHRLNAYRLAGYRQDVPVRVFSGTLDQAIATALRSNSKDKLSMSRAEKSEAAWRVVIGTELSKASIAAAANVSERTVAYMREAVRKIQAAHSDVPLDSLRWRDADAIAKGLEPKQQVGSDDWIEAEAQKLANRLCKTFGDRLGRQVEVTARALEIYSERLVAGLSEHWSATLDDEDDEDYGF